MTSLDDFIDQVDAPQISELLDNHGKVSVLWFDTPADMNRERAEKIAATIVPRLKGPVELKD